MAGALRHADYIGSWLKALREDNRAIIRAASAASKPADYLLALQPGATAVNHAMAEARSGGGSRRLAARAKVNNLGFQIERRIGATLSVLPCSRAGKQYQNID